MSKDTTAIQRLELWCELVDARDEFHEHLTADIRALIKVAEAAKDYYRIWGAEELTQADAYSSYERVVEALKGV
jgi:hypothetical protein